MAEPVLHLAIPKDDTRMYSACLPRTTQCLTSVLGRVSCPECAQVVENMRRWSR